MVGLHVVGQVGGLRVAEGTLHLHHAHPAHVHLAHMQLQVVLLVCCVRTVWTMLVSYLLMDVFDVLSKPLFGAKILFTLVTFIPLPWCSSTGCVCQVSIDSLEHPTTNITGCQSV